MHLHSILPLSERPYAFYVKRTINYLKQYPDSFDNLINLLKKT